VSRDAARYAEVHAILLGSPRLRAGSEDVVAAMLAELADLADDEPAPDWVPPDPVADLTLTAGEVRARLRLTLTELAARNEQPPWA
jgi:hypothetical protein